MPIKFLVTADRIGAVLSPVEYFGILEGNVTENYHAMLKFMTDDGGDYLDLKAAQKAMRDTDMQSFWKDHLPNFVQALRDALVSPTNAGG